jgi:Chitobiase/beta-hexosaminidase C-terminal domain
MKAETLKLLRRTWGQFKLNQPWLASLLLAVALIPEAHAQTTVTTLAGVNGLNSVGTAGYRDGITYNYAEFNAPAGIALDPSGSMLFVADYNNSAIRVVDTVGSRGSSYTWTAYTTNGDGINHPIAVAVDSSYNIFVLNHGTDTLGTNGTLLEFSGAYLLDYGLNILIATNASKLTNAVAMAMDNTTNIYVIIKSNTVIRVSSPGVTTVVGVITNAGTSLRGIAVTDNGQLALTDAGNNGIWLMTPNSAAPTNSAVKFTGFHGAHDTNGPPAYAAFNRPENIIKAGGGVLVVADRYNNKIKTIDTNGTVTRLYGVNSNYWTGTTLGWQDGKVNPIEQLDNKLPVRVQARQPYGLAMGQDSTIYITEDYYHLLREATGTGLLPPPPPPPADPTILTITATNNPAQVTLTWLAVNTATNYNVKRSESPGTEGTIAVTSITSYTDTNVVSGKTYFYVVSASNAGGESQNSREVNITVPFLPAPTPQIGIVDFPSTATPEYSSVFHSISVYTMNSNTPIVISESDGSPVNYYFSQTPTNDSSTNIFTPTNFPNSAVQGYANGQYDVSRWDIYSIIQQYPDVTVWAVAPGVTNLIPSSPVAKARFRFVTGNPIIIGTNSAQFTVTDPATAGAYFYYTVDGSDPLTSSNRLYIPPFQITNGFSIKTDTLLKIRAFYANYQPSDIVSNLFTLANYRNNTISFGFVDGEASSVFIASPGQTFYAPVTLTTVANPTIYSLQFNISVTNATATNPVTGFGFKSMLEKPILNTPDLFEIIPPAMFVSSASVPNPINYDGSTQFSSLLFTNSNLGLLAVGWLERKGQTNLYDTRSQTLITYSQAHDDLFPTPINPNGVILGGYNIQIPTNAQPGDTYQIQIGRPSATSDGIGATASKVVTIDSPTNGAPAGGAPISALKYVTVTNIIPYLAGSVYPFRWFNAGDFGSSNIVAADVAQVFEAAVYYLNSPAFQAPGSDFFDAMDSCGNLGVLDTNPSDPNYNYYTNALSAPNTTLLFDGNDTTINQVAFGDGNLDVSDIYVTYRRSLDPSLTWFRRFWNNGQRVADTGITNHAANLSSKALISSSSQIQPKISVSSPYSAAAPQVNFSAGDVIGTAGQTVQIPINAIIYGQYPLRLLMLNLTVTPLDGSPALTSAVQFTPNPALGAPYTVDAKGIGNYSAVWLNNAISGLIGSTNVGTLTVTIPAGASGNAAYAVHFDHASASPNGLGSFPKQTLTGLITLNGRTNSVYCDGIPDSWRLRWFGTTNNLLSLSNACPSGDGINNFQKYVAGVDPNTANNFPSLKPKSPAPKGVSSAIHWPTVNGKQYIIERSASLFPGTWSAISTNTGTGTDMEYDDNFGSAVKFYRVRILP